MPETRYIKTYEYPEGLAPDMKTIDKATITTSSYEVSDEELAEEQKTERMANILDEIDELKTKVEKLEKK